MGSFISECIALREGLLFSKTNGLKIAMVDSDCILPVNATNSSNASVVVASIILDICWLLEDVGGGTCGFIFGEGNFLALILSPKKLLFTITQFVG